MLQKGKSRTAAGVGPWCAFCLYSSAFQMETTLFLLHYVYLTLLQKIKPVIFLWDMMQSYAISLPSGTKSGSTSRQRWSYGEKAAKPMTTVQDCVSTFVRVKPLDILTVFIPVCGEKIWLTREWTSPALFLVAKREKKNDMMFLISCCFQSEEKYLKKGFL